MTVEDRVAAYYAVTGLGRRIEQVLAEAGKDLDALTLDDLAPIDAFHVRGRRATEELAVWAGLRSGDRVLDVGCGLGGTGRYLAAAVGCRTTGVDLTEEYCRTAEMLSARLGLADRTEFRTGSALALPVLDAAFDVAWTEHVQMNVADKERFYGEMRRALAGIPVRTALLEFEGGVHGLVQKRDGDKAFQAMAVRVREAFENFTAGK